VHYQGLGPLVAQKTQAGFNSMEFNDICDYVDSASQQRKQEPEGNRKASLLLGVPYMDDRKELESYLTEMACRPSADRSFSRISRDADNTNVDVGRRRFENAADDRINAARDATHGIR
jgi:hypothetical protein